MYMSKYIYVRSVYSHLSWHLPLSWWLPCAVGYGVIVGARGCYRRSLFLRDVVCTFAWKAEVRYRQRQTHETRCELGVKSGDEDDARR